MKNPALIATLQPTLLLLLLTLKYLLLIARPLFLAVLDTLLNVPHPLVGGRTDTCFLGFFTVVNLPFIYEDCQSWQLFIGLGHSLWPTF